MEYHCFEIENAEPNDKKIVPDKVNTVHSEAVEVVVGLAREEEVFIPLALVLYMGALGPCPKCMAAWQNSFEAET